MFNCSLFPRNNLGRHIQTD